MAAKVVYQAGGWPDLTVGRERAEPALVIIPGPESRQNAINSFGCSKTDIFLTIPELIARYIQSHSGKGLISPHAAESILGEIMAESSVPYLKMEKYRQSYVRALAGFIGNFRAASLTGLEEAMAEFRGGNLSFKEQDLIKIYREYERRLADLGHDLRSGIFEFLRQTDRDSINRHFGLRENESVIFWGFDYITPLEAEFIYTVFKHLPRTSFFFCADGEAAEQSTRIGKSAACLIERLKHLGVEHKTLPLKRRDFFIDLSRRLFRPESTTGPGAPAVPLGDRVADSCKKVTISQANNRFQEITDIARQIRRLAGAGVSLNEIRVVAPEYQLYSSIIAEVFPDYGLAFSPEQGVPLLRYPLAMVILQLVTQGTGANLFPLREKILSSPYISFSDEVRPENLAAYQEACGVELLSHKMLDRHLSPGSHRLDYSYISSIRREAYRTIKPASGAPPLEVAGRYLKNTVPPEELEACLCRCLLQFYLLAQAEKALSAWQPKLSSERFAGILQKLLQRFRVAENIGLAEDSPLALQAGKRDRVILNRIHQLLAEMVSSLAAAGGPGEKYTMAELARLFSRLLNEASLCREEYGAVGDSAVSVQPVNRGQYQEWAYTFICGLVDGEFPAAEEFNFLQPKKDGLGLGRTYTSVDYGRHRFYQLVRSTTGALFLSRPLSDNGRRLPPSPFILDIEKRVPAELRQAESPEHGTRRDSLISRREKLLFIGKNVDKDYNSVLPLLRELKDEDREFFANVVEILRFDGLTMNTARFSQFDGLFSHEPSSSPPADSALALLARQINKIRFTPAVLERYAACPLRFFFDDILNLKQGPDYDPDTTETWRLVRSLLKEYTTKACHCGGVPGDAPLLFLEAVDRQLKEREPEEVDAFHARFINSLTAGLESGVARRRGLLAAFLEYEKNGPDLLLPYLPGLAGPVAVGEELEVWVETDRVDLAGETGRLLAFNYTGGGAGNPGRIRRGLRFDLPLAVLLVMDYVAEKQLNLEVAGAGLYQVKTAKTVRRGGYFAAAEIRTVRQANVSPRQPVFSGQREGFMARKEFSEALNRCREHILRLHRLMQKGVFHLPLCTAAEQTCYNCSFGRLCRKDQLRLEKLRSSTAGDDLSAAELNLISSIF